MMPPQKFPKLEVSQADLEKVAKARARHEGTKVSPEWLFIAEFGYYFGWEGVQAIRNNEISLPEAKVLLEGANKVWYGKLVQQGQVSFTASVAANSKKGQAVLDKGLKVFKQQMKADE